MPEYVRAYSSEDGNTLVSVPAAFAKNNGLHTVKDDATDRRGNPLPPSEGYRNKTTAKKAASSTTTTGGSAASNAEEA